MITSFYERLCVTALLLSVTLMSMGLARGLVYRERQKTASQPLRFLIGLSGVVLVAVASLIAAVTTLFGL